MKKLYCTAIMLFLVFFSPSFAAQDYYQLTTLKQQQQFKSLTTNLRCLVCQNENLYESNANLAEDLRKQIVKKIQQGQSNEQIIHYLTARYSNYILYRPPLNTRTIGLWLGPFLLLIFSISYLFYYLSRQKNV